MWTPEYANLVMTTGGLPISTGQPIDLSSPNFNLIMALEWVADKMQYVRG